MVPDIARILTPDHIPFVPPLSPKKTDYCSLFLS